MGGDDMGDGTGTLVAEAVGRPKGLMLKTVALAVTGKGATVGISNGLVIGALELSKTLTPRLATLPATLKLHSALREADNIFERRLSGYDNLEEPSMDDTRAVADALATFQQRHDAFVDGHPGVALLSELLGADATQPPPAAFDGLLELLDTATWGGDILAPTLDTTACVILPAAAPLL